MADANYGQPAGLGLAARTTVGRGWLQPAGWRTAGGRATVSGPSAARFRQALALASGARAEVRVGTISRVSQTNAAEYDSAEQARGWGGSTCSAASLTAVLRSRGLPVRIADVLRAMPGGVTPEQGLVSRPALVQAAARYGLKAADDVTDYG